MERTFQKQRNCRGFVDSDAPVVEGVDFERIDKTVFGNNGGEHDQESIELARLRVAMVYLGDVINLTPAERVVMACRIFLTPKMPIRTLAGVLKTQPCVIRRHIRRAVAKMRLAPPVFTQKPNHNNHNNDNGE